MSAVQVLEVDVRASAVLDMPLVRDKHERRAYVRGYAQGCLTFVKKTGIPEPDDLRSLSQVTREAEWARHPAAHKKGLAALKKYVAKYPTPTKEA